MGIQRGKQDMDEHWLTLERGWKMEQLHQAIPPWFSSVHVKHEKNWNPKGLCLSQPYLLTSFPLVKEIIIIM